MENSLSPAHFRIHLQAELARRCRVNTRYSLRSYAKFLNLDPSSLSQILAGKRSVSSRMIDRICRKIGWPGEISPSEGSNYSLLAQDTFAAISDWYHYSILDLTLVKGFRNDPEWIAKKLGISKVDVRGAVERLKRLGMLVENKGRLLKAEARYSNYIEGQTSMAHKEYQRQIVQKALLAIDECPQEKKDITCITIAADSKKILEAKTRIKKFRRDLCEYLERGEGDSVYVLAIQLFPTTNTN